MLRGRLRDADEYPAWRLERERQNLEADSRWGVSDGKRGLTVRVVPTAVRVLSLFPFSNVASVVNLESSGRLR